MSSYHPKSSSIQKYEFWSIFFIYIIWSYLVNRSKDIQFSLKKTTPVVSYVQTHHLKISRFWFFSRVNATLDADIAHCEYAIDMVDDALDTLGLTLSDYNMVGFASDVFRAERGVFYWRFFGFFLIFFQVSPHDPVLETLSLYIFLFNFTCENCFEATWSTHDVPVHVCLWPLY